MKEKRSTTKHIILSLVMFMMVFLPPLFKMSMTYIWTAVMILYLMVSMVFRRKIILKFDIGLKLLIGFAPFLLYVLVQVAINVAVSASKIESSAYIYNVSHVILSFIYIVVCYLFMKSISLKNTNTELDWATFLILGTVFEAFLIFASFINTNLHNIFLDFYLRNARNDIMLDHVSRFRWRAFGLSSYYFDNLSFILSGCGIIAFIKGFSEKKYIYFIFGFLISASSLVGSRTGIVLMGIGIILGMIYYGFKKGLKSILKWILVIVFSVIAIYFILNTFDEAFRDWILKGLNAVALLFNNNRSDAFIEILGSDVVFPSNMLFGLGAKPETLGFYDAGGGYIDSGYVQLVWRFGIIGTVLLLGGIIRFYRLIYKESKSDFAKGVAVVLPVIMLLYFFKFYPITVYGAHVVFFVLPTIMCINEREGFET